MTLSSKDLEDRGRFMLPCCLSDSVFFYKVMAFFQPKKPQTWHLLHSVLKDNLSASNSPCVPKLPQLAGVTEHQPSPLNPSLGISWGEVIYTCGRKISFPSWGCVPKKLYV